MDAPGSVAFFGRRALVTNHSALAGNPQSWAVLDLFAGERGLPLIQAADTADPPLKVSKITCGGFAA